ncbi:MAG: fluoride efflux transporter CrcB [Gemmatimonadetes bacterium]|nr:fluoride efflux transporter CrcB [Gemmatimonadota bacterium]
MGTILSVAAGGALGAVARYGAGSWIQQATRSTFPWGTLVVNVTGSLALGFLVVWLREAAASVELRAFVTVGVLGGYTTFSTFTYETVLMAQNGEWRRAGAYAFGSLALGLVAVVLGMAAADALLGKPT